jgi:pimeloyl-ACP methyl ester carboxylesterase
MVRKIVLILLAGQLSTAFAKPPMPGRLVDVGGHRVHLYCTGQGSPTVVVVSGGFSFDWALIQPPISRLTRICTYDPAGTAWSDPATSRTRYGTDRVDELHTLLAAANEKEPYVLVGYSIGGPIVRLYTERNREQVAGVVLVDHAFVDIGSSSDVAQQKDGPVTRAGLDSPPVLLSQTPIQLDMQDDQNFSKLPARERDLHKWALSVSVRPTPEDAAECMRELSQEEKELGGLPLAVVSTPNNLPQYALLQKKLLALSSNSKQYLAEQSTHMVIIDQPEVVIQAISDVVRDARMKH